MWVSLVEIGERVGLPLCVQTRSVIFIAHKNILRFDHRMVSQALCLGVAGQCTSWFIPVLSFLWLIEGGR